MWNVGRSANRDMVVSASKLTRQTAALVSIICVSMLHSSYASRP